MVGESRSRMTSLRAVLAGAKTDACDAQVMLGALRSSWCWPPGSDELTVLERRISKPAPASVGQALLVSATEGRQALWGLRRWKRSELQRSAGCSYPVHSARWLARLEAGEITRALPFVLRFPVLPSGEWRADLIVRIGPGKDKYLEGDSYGVGIALALASLNMDEPVPEDLVASATVLEDGRLGRVEGLKEKMSIVWNWAPGVTRFVVAEPQREEALALAQTCAPGLRIVAAGSLVEVLDLAYTGYRVHGAPGWRAPARAIEVAEFVYDIALRSPAVLDWSAVERPAVILASILPTGSDEHEGVKFAKSVARRHQGKPYEPLPWLESKDPSSRHLQRLAHVIQSATDSANPVLQEWVEKAKLQVNAPLSDEELEVVGAIGRAQAVLGAYEDARRTLGQALDAWFERRCESHCHAGRPLCELLRVLGLMGEVGAVSDLRSKIDACRLACEESSEPASACYLPLAEGMAWVLLGQPAEALRLLENDEDWKGANDQVCDARVRWLAAALDLFGDRAAASEQRAVLIGLGNTNPNALLAELDHLLLDSSGAQSDDEFGRLLDLLEELDPSIVRFRQRAQGDGQRDQAKRVTREYPY